MYPDITLFGHSFHTYSILFYLGLASVLVVLFFLKKPFSYSWKRWLTISALTLVFGLISAKLTSLAETYAFYFSSHGEYGKAVLEPFRIYGIPMFLPVFFLIYSLLFRDKFREITDYIAPCVYSVMTLVKTGCAMGGCCYGEPDPHGIMNVDLGYKTFPVQIYDAISSFVIMVICIILIHTLRKKHEGLIYPIGGMLFAVTKGFWENFRVHNSTYEKNFLGTNWTFWQYWMMILFIGCFIWLMLTIRQRKKEIPDFDERDDLRFPQIKLPKIKKKSTKKKNNKKRK